MIQHEDFDENQQLALAKWNDFKFDSNNYLPHDVVAALAFCKIYNESEYKKFVGKCKAFKLYTQIVKQEIEAYVRKLKHLIKQEHNLKKVKDKQEKDREFEERRNRNIAGLQELQDKLPNDDRDEIMIALINQSLELNGAGMPIANVKNYELIFNYDPNISNCIGYDAFFIDSLGVENLEYSRQITFYWLKSAVARILYPDCKADHCIVLKCKQGKEKSTMLSKLGGI